MKSLLILISLAVAACSSGPPPLSVPPGDAAVWDLNPEHHPGYGSNDLIHPAEAN